MRSIYSHFLECQEKGTTSIDQDIENLVRSKLVFLLKQSFDIDVSNSPIAFSRKTNILNLEFGLNYNFKYGDVLVTTSKDKMMVIFHFINTELKIPFEPYKCLFLVDHNLNFKESTIRRVFTLDNIHQDDYANLLFMVDHNRFDKINKIKYKTKRLNTYVDMSNFHLNPYYLKHDIEFQLNFTKIMNTCINNPKIFYAIFSDYPSYDEFIADVHGAVKFLNLFCDHYLYDNDTLKSRISLLEMIMIT